MLSRLRKPMTDRDKGFTLIELLVVINIIIILAAIAIPVFLNQRKKGVDASIETDIKNMATLQETYGTDHRLDLDGFEITIPQATTGSVLIGTNLYKKSPGNWIYVVPRGTSGGYCIRGGNSGSSKGGAANSQELTELFYYDSLAGGLGVMCWTQPHHHR